MNSLTIKITPAFERAAKRLIDRESLEELCEFLSTNPTDDSVIRGTGGVRKIRWKTKLSNKGKSGSLRLLYHYSNGILVILLAL